MAALAVGHMYELRTPTGSTVVDTVKVLGPPNPVDGLVPVLSDGREMRVDMRQYRAVRTRRPVRARVGPRVYLYLCHIGANAYKLGASAAPELRRRAIRTHARDARMLIKARLPAHQTRRFPSFEKAVLREFQHCTSRRGGTEVLTLMPSEVEDCKRAIRAVCLRGV